MPPPPAIVGEDKICPERIQGRGTRRHQQVRGETLHLFPLLHEGVTEVRAGTSESVDVEVYARRRAPHVRPPLSHSIRYSALCHTVHTLTENTVTMRRIWNSRQRKKNGNGRLKGLANIADYSVA